VQQKENSSIQKAKTAGARGRFSENQSWLTNDKGGKSGGREGKERAVGKEDTATHGREVFALVLTS